MYAVGAGAAAQTGSMGPIFAGLGLTGPAAPFIMAAAALVQPLTKIIRGCGQTCIDASKYADTAEQYIKQLHQSYFAELNRCKEAQVAALQYIDGVFAWLERGCSAVGGNAGRNCISERLVKGGSAPWCPTGTGCDWITLYRDPIANDPQVKPCSVGGSVASVLGLEGSDSGSGIWLIALLLIAILIIKRKRKG